MSKTFHPLPIKEIIQETAATKTLIFSIPEELKSAFEYKQGQYLTLKFTIKGEEARRAYSMSSSPLEDQLAVTVKRVEKGLVSNYIHDELKAGQTIEVMPPEGRFYIKLNPDLRRTFYIFGAGSGITPLLSIIKTTLEKEPQSTVHLLYGNRDEASIIFREQLKELEKRYAGQFSVSHILSRPKLEKSKGLAGLFSKAQSTWTGKKGRIGETQIQEFLQLNKSRTSEANYFICGPNAMMDTVKEALQASGIDNKHIHLEYFTNNSEGEHKVPTKSEGASLIIHLDGQEIKLPSAPGKTVLTTLLENKYDPPYSCTSGSCSSCMAKIKSGSAEMEFCLALDEEEVKEGYILTCQAHPTSETLEITYDV